MEIDLSPLSKLSDWDRKALGIAGILVVLITLILLGRSVTGERRILTWQEWNIRKAERLYQAELRLLREQAVDLASVFQSEPVEPVRAAIVARTVEQKVLSVKSLALEDRKNILLAAAQSVSDWAGGGLDYNTAVSAVEAALRALENE